MPTKEQEGADELDDEILDVSYVLSSASFCERVMGSLNVSISLTKTERWWKLHWLQCLEYKLSSMRGEMQLRGMK